MDNNLDRKWSPPYRYDDSKKFLIDISDLDLLDAYRHIEPQPRKFTWNDGEKGSRLDRLYIPRRTADGLPTSPMNSPS